MDTRPADPHAFDATDAERENARDSLLLTASVRFSDAMQPVTVRVRNLSAGGLMAEYDGAVTRGAAVKLELRGIGTIAGHVAWVTDGRVGVAFENAVDPMLARKPVAVPKRPPVKPRFAV